MGRSRTNAVDQSPVMLLPHRIREFIQYQRRAQVFGATRTLWETSEVTTAANAVDQSPVMLLPHRIRHCRNLQQLLQVMRRA